MEGPTDQYAASLEVTPPSPEQWPPTEPSYPYRESSLQERDFCNDYGSPHSIYELGVEGELRKLENDLSAAKHDATITHVTLQRKLDIMDEAQRSYKKTIEHLQIYVPPRSDPAYPWVREDLVQRLDEEKAAFVALSEEVEQMVWRGHMARERLERLELKKLKLVRNAFKRIAKLSC